MIKQMLAIWALVPLLFLNPAWTSGSSQVPAEVLLKPGLDNFEHYLLACGSSSILWDWNEYWPFPVLWPLLSFPNLLHIECSTFTAPSSRIWNSSTGFPSPPLALFAVTPPEAHLPWHSGCLALGEWSHDRGYLGHEDLFFHLQNNPKYVGIRFPFTDGDFQNQVK